MDHVEPKSQNTEFDEQIDQRDAVYKQKMKKYREEKQTKKTLLLLGDYVLVKQPKKNKRTTPYEPVFYTTVPLRINLTLRLRPFCVRLTGVFFAV